MSVNNRNRPIGQGVGNTYGERQRFNAANISPEQQVQRHRDVFGVKPSPIFSPNAKYNNGRLAQPLKSVETGKTHERPKITDDMRLAFLNRIAGAGENRPPIAGRAQNNIKIQNPKSK